MDQLRTMLNGQIDDYEVIQKLCLTYQKKSDLNLLLQHALSCKKYCHPESAAINAIIALIPPSMEEDDEKAKWLFHWCIEKLNYGRLKKPLFPLVRTDLDVLELKEGTCGDFSHLFVSFMMALNIKVKYVRVVRDIHNDEQDHLCGCFYSEKEQRWVLVDPTPSYGRVSGWDIMHREYQMLDKHVHWKATREEEKYWACRSAEKYNSLLLAGLIFAPWVYEEIIDQSSTEVVSVFVLFTLTVALEWTLTVTCHVNSRQARLCPIRLRRSSENDVWEWDECIEEGYEVWDEKRWSSKNGVTDAARKQNVYLDETVRHLEIITLDLFHLIRMVEEGRVR